MFPDLENFVWPKPHLHAKFLSIDGRFRATLGADRCRDSPAFRTMKLKFAAFSFIAQNHNFEEPSNTSHHPISSSRKSQNRE
jgi:hypothetical protein